MSEGTDAPFSTVDINNDNRDDEDLFASAVQDVESLDHEINGVRQSLEDASLGDVSLSKSASIGSPMMEEIATERANNIIITITEPQKMGEGMSSYVAYRVLTKTNMPIFSRHEFAVLRRFSDFLGLHEKLTEKYLRSGRIIPPAPEKSIVGTTKMKMTSTPSTESANDTELPKATSTSALSGAGMLRLFNKVGETVNKITYRMDESDPRLCGACEVLANERRELAVRSHETARSIAAAAAADPHAPLSRALSHLSDLYEKIEHLRVEQSNTDFYVLTEHIKDYLGLIGAIKDVFHERWESKVERSKQEFDTISRVIKKELERWEEIRITELRDTVLRYLEEHSMRYWDAFLPEARAIK
ncbi:unnamed protein product [Leptidea sinapis]|uniref:PX domain-containing protein n=1 Tax=Leptidea sinapis TaxID=189913 RepID=A0A5E4QFD2_9NEOP|nr:unnamed protein product [Leptidea sinapis]